MSPHSESDPSLWALIHQVFVQSSHSDQGSHSAAFRWIRLMWPWVCIPSSDRQHSVSHVNVDIVLLSPVCSLTNCPLVLLDACCHVWAALEPRKHLNRQINPVLTPSRLIPMSTAFRWSSPALSRLRLFSLVRKSYLKAPVTRKYHTHSVWAHHRSTRPCLNKAKASGYSPYVMWL